MDFPLFLPSIGGGVLIGIVAILHVVVSHFAVGGGIALGILEAISVKRGRDEVFRETARRGSKILILVSTVFGALSGVGIWFTIGVVHPAGTADLIRLFVWVWATEWAFFLLEIVVALLYYSTWDKVTPRTHLLLIGLYAFAAYMSLVIIQGILSFMSTPGAWPKSGSIIDAFFNPTYLPGLVFRTGSCLMLAGTYLMLAALREKNVEARTEVVRVLAGIEAAGVALAAVGAAWWEKALDPAVQAYFSGAKPLLKGMSTTRDLFIWSIVAAGVLALAALLLPRFHRWPLAVAALLAGFAVLGSYERLREGSRKPYLIRPFMFSNGVLSSEIDALNEKGILSKARWAGTGLSLSEPGRPGRLQTGAAVFRAQCASCHTLDGYLGIKKMVEPADMDILNMILSAMKDDGLKRKQIAAGETVVPDYILMPPFVGTEQEKEALAEYLDSLKKPSSAH